VVGEFVSLKLPLDILNHFHSLLIIWSMLILFSHHLLLGLPSRLFAIGFPTKILYLLLVSPLAQLPRSHYLNSSSWKFLVHYPNCSLHSSLVQKFSLALCFQTLAVYVHPSKEEISFTHIQNYWQKYSVFWKVERVRTVLSWIIKSISRIYSSDFILNLAFIY
jgi:hypothetical protein